MLHMVIMRHSPTRCPFRESNEMEKPCINPLDDLIKERGVTFFRQWSDPPGHASYMILDSENAVAIQELFINSELTNTMEVDIRPVLRKE